MIALLLGILVLYGATALALSGIWRAVDEREREQRLERERRAAQEALWERFAPLGAFVIGGDDLREAGWSVERARAFLAEHFGGRESVRLVELRPFLADVMVRDVLEYREKRFAAAKRFEPIRQTWINVDDLVKGGRLPHELTPFVCERERQSGKLIRATDLLPFVGRPIVRELLEKKLTDCGLA